MSVADADSSAQHLEQAGMRLVPGGTFRMGSDKQYRERAPVHRVIVDGFWMDLTPVMNRRFREFVEATGHVSFAEIAPKLEDYPGALPHRLQVASLVLVSPDHPADTSMSHVGFGCISREKNGP
jgi:sulfatase modifying factor 1